jgi:hypothetical protein
VNGAMTVLGAIVGGVLGGWIGIRETLVIAVVGMAGGALFIVFSPLRNLKEIPAEARILDSNPP